MSSRKTATPARQSASPATEPMKGIAASSATTPSANRATWKLLMGRVYQSRARQSAADRWSSKTHATVWWRMWTAAAVVPYDDSLSGVANAARSVGLGESALR